MGSNRAHVCSIFNGGHPTTQAVIHARVGNTPYLYSNIINTVVDNYLLIKLLCLYRIKN